MASEFSVKRVGNKLEELVYRAKIARGAKIDVGVHADDAQRPIESDHAPTARDAITNGQLAEIHEFGKGHVPARPFLRPVFFENRARYHRIGAKQFKKFVDGEETSVSAALMTLGNIIVSDIQKRIIRGIDPPLAERTVISKRNRGLPRPHVALFATGALFSAIKARYVGANR